ISSEGELLWGEDGVLVSQNTAEHPYFISLAVTDSAGGAIISWNDSSGCHSQRVDSGGTLLWDSDVVPGGLYLVSDGEGGSIMVCCESENDSIRTQRIDGNGIKQWGEKGTVFTIRKNIFSFTTVSDDNGGMILVWDEIGIPPNRGILAQRVNSYGQLGNIASVYEPPGVIVPDEVILHQNYPNPFNTTTIINYQLPSYNAQFPVTLKIFDVLGREIKTLVNEEQSAGIYSVLWDGKDNLGKEIGSGVYFYQLDICSVTETKKLTSIK
ncbi:MAG: T9SS type A sorting domain-containing protein, partial [Candidatus Zixiibacteriota bacterium]